MGFSFGRQRDSVAREEIDNHAYRIDRAEERAAETNQTIRMVEHTLNQLSSDLRVTREILERMEANSRSPPPD